MPNHQGELATSHHVNFAHTNPTAKRFRAPESVILNWQIRGTFPRDGNERGARTR